MTNEAFVALLESRIGKMREVLDAKRAEYATARDQLHNFKVAGAMQQRTPAQALVGMWAKHLVSILDLVEADAAGQKAPAKVLDEKIGDAINYLVLLEATLKE